MRKIIDADEPLTPQQVRVCELLCEGYTYAMISKKMGISFDRVNEAMWSARKKLRADNAQHLVAIFLKRTLKCAKCQQWD